MKIILNTKNSYKLTKYISKKIHDKILCACKARIKIQWCFKANNKDFIILQARLDMKQQIALIKIPIQKKKYRDM